MTHRIRVRRSGGKHREVRATYPCRPGQYTLGIADPSPVVLVLDGDPLATQADVVTRHEDGSAAILQLRALLPEGLPVEERFFDVQDTPAQSGVPNLAEWDPDVLQLAISKLGAVLVVEDYFGNRYFAPLTRDLAGFAAGPRAVQLDVFGPNAIRAEIPEWMLPAPKEIYTPTPELLHHFGLVTTRMTTRRASSVMELDFKWANASADKPLGTLWFRSLSILLPPDFSYRSRLPLQEAWPSADDDFGFDAHYLVAPRTDGKMHVLHQNQSMRFRLLVFEHDAYEQAQQILDDDGWGSCAEAWGQDGRTGFNTPQFPVPTYDHLSDPDYWSRESKKRIVEAFEQGNPHLDPLGSGLGGDGRLGPYPVCGGAYGGQTAGTGKEFWAGMVECATAMQDGLQFFRYLNDGWQNRMDDGCVWDASCHPPHATVTALRDLPSYDRWRYSDGWQRKSWPNGDQFQDEPWNYDDVQSLDNPSDIEPEARNAQVIPDSAKADYAKLKAFDGWNSLYNGYMRNDAQHLIRTTCAAEALIWLDNDALSKHDAEELAFCGRLMFLEGKHGRLYETAHPSVPNAGGELGRGRSHVAQAWSLYWHVATDRDREWLAGLLGMFVLAHEVNLTKTGTSYVTKSGKALLSIPGANHAIVRENELSYAAITLESIRASMPSLADRVRPVMERLLADAVMTHCWIKNQQGELGNATWSHTAVAPVAQSNDPDAYFEPGQHPPAQYEVMPSSFGLNMALAVALKLGIEPAPDRVRRLYGQDPLAGIRARGWEWMNLVRAGLMAILEKPSV